MSYYATYENFTAVYSAHGISQAEVNSAHLFHGWLRVNESLGAYFTTPFSSNNWTARDLNVHFAYLNILLRTANQEDSEELNTDLRQRITDIISGTAAMVNEDGSILTRVESINIFEAWSPTSGYKPTFDMRDPENQRVDPDRIDDLWDADR